MQVCTRSSLLWLLLCAIACCFSVRIVLSLAYVAEVIRVVQINKRTHSITTAHEEQNAQIIVWNATTNVMSGVQFAAFRSIDRLVYVCMPRVCVLTRALAFRTTLSNVRAQIEFACRANRLFGSTLIAIEWKGRWRRRWRRMTIAFLMTMTMLVMLRVKQYTKSSRFLFALWFSELYARSLGALSTSINTRANNKGTTTTTTPTITTRPYTHTHTPKDLKTMRDL